MFIVYYNGIMQTSKTIKTVDKSSDSRKRIQYLLDKRAELVWALSLQDYSQANIAYIFNVDPAVINRIIKRIPQGWQPKWKKVG